MRYLAARQFKAEDGRLFWHYTAEHRDEIHPVGYCSALRKCLDCNPDGQKIGWTGPRADKPRPFLCTTCEDDSWIWLPRGEACPGHETAVEACDHYKEYLLTERLQFHSDTHGDTQYRCNVPECQVFTQSYVTVDGWPRYNLCNEHLNIDAVRGLFQVGSSAES